MDRQMLQRLAEWVDPYRVTDGARFRLKRVNPGDTAGLGSETRRQAAERLAYGVRWLAVEQDKLYVLLDPEEIARGTVKPRKGNMIGLNFVSERGLTSD